MKNYTEEYLNMVNAEPPNSTERREILQGYRKENARQRETIADLHTRIRHLQEELNASWEGDKITLGELRALYKKRDRKIMNGSACALCGADKCHHRGEMNVYSNLS